MPRELRGRHRTTTLMFPSPASAMVSRWWTRPLSYECLRSIIEQLECHTCHARDTRYERELDYFIAQVVWQIIQELRDVKVL